MLNNCQRGLSALSQISSLMQIIIFVKIKKNEQTDYRIY